MYPLGVLPANEGHFNSTSILLQEHADTHLNSPNDSGKVHAQEGQIQSGYVKVSNDLTLYFEQAGHGAKTIVFIPGWTMSTEVYEHQLNYFKNSNEWRFITYDPRGQGRSTKTEGGHFYEQHGRDLKNFLEALDLHSVVLGGLVLWRIRNVVLCTTIRFRSSLRIDHD